PMPGGYHKDEGVHVGEAIADDILALRADDGSAAQPPAFTPGAKPGDYRPTPPKFGQPVFTHWARVHPFVLRAAAQFRPAPPPAVTSSAYTASLREVERLGSAASTGRSAGQTQGGQVRNKPLRVVWNEIAQAAALAHHDSLLQNARLFALLDLTLADSTIALYDAKYTYGFWRPVTAIQATDDPGWTPLTPTAADPSYPGAHSTIS